MRSHWFRLSILCSAVLPILVSAATWSDRRLIFNADSRAYVQKLMQTGVTTEIWKSDFQGPDAFDLPAYRKGLYGAEALSGTSLYALYEMLGGVEPWVMIIQVKKECIEKPNRTDGMYTILLQGKGSGGRFSDWYLAHRAKYRPLEKLCMIPSNGVGTWLEGPHYDVGSADPEDQRLSHQCSPVLNDFLNAEKVKLVFDVVNSDSWYIRDPSCVEAIKGTPDELFDIIVGNRMGDDENRITDNLFGDTVNSGAYVGGSTVIVAKVLAETTRLDSGHLDVLNAMLKDVTSYIGKDVEPRALSLQSNRDNEFILRHLVIAAIGAIRDARVGEFQHALQARLQEMTVNSGAACHGAHGVPAQYQAACAATTADETKRLVDLLKGFGPQS